MTFGMPENVKALQGIVGNDEFREVLERNKNGVAGCQKKQQDMERGYANSVCYGYGMNGIGINNALSIYSV